jgi:formylglycine-generating enzyme
MKWPIYASVFVFVACAAGQPAPPSAMAQPSPASSGRPETPVAAEPPAAVEGQRDAAVSSEHAAAEPNAASSAAAPAEPSACPVGMTLVEGDYCTDAEQTCLQSWYDKSNKKTICEVFEPPSRCVGPKVHKRFCIDTYEWPNVQGVRPEVMNRFHQAEVKCAAVGKRMCTESEWTFACEGPEIKPFPYGYVRDPRKCNGEHKWDSPDMGKVAARDADELARLWKGVPSGTQPQCVSDFGVADLPANTDEVVASETTVDGWRGKFDSVHTGGPWYGGVRNQCRPKIYTHDEGFYYYFLSFRCCAEPDGAATDPRTPKQRKADWTFERVERIAGFTREEVRAALALKKQQGHCGCSDKKGQERVRCDTLCGTLLGPGARDATQPPATGVPPFGAEQRATPEQLRSALEAGAPRKTR